MGEINNKIKDTLRTEPDISRELFDIIKETQKTTNEILKLTLKMRRYLFWHQIFGIVKILIIIVPIVVAIIYIPRLLDDLKEKPAGFFDSSMFSGFSDMITDKIIEKSYK